MTGERGLLAAARPGDIHVDLSTSSFAMVRRPRAAFERVEPVLSSLGSDVFHLGDSGAGTLTKLANNAVFLCAGLDAPIFQLSHAEKDVALALDSARALAVPMPVVASTRQTYVQALAQGLGTKVFFATLRAIEAAAGTEVPKLPAAS